MGCRVYLAITFDSPIACVLLTFILLLNGSLPHVTDPSLDYVQCLEIGGSLFIENNWLAEIHALLRSSKDWMRRCVFQSMVIQKLRTEQ